MNAQSEFKNPLFEAFPDYDPQKTTHLWLGMTSPFWGPYLAATNAAIGFWWSNRFWQNPLLQSDLFKPTEAVVNAIEAIEEVADKAMAAPLEAMLKVEEAIADKVFGDYQPDAAQIVAAKSETTEPVTPRPLARELAVKKGKPKNK